MKNLLYVIILFFPVTVVSQPILFGSSVTSNKWKNVGNPLFSESTIDFPSLAISPTDQPYVAFSDSEKNDRSTVMVFNGTSWVTLGNAGFTSDKALCSSLKFSPVDSLPYLAFVDYSSTPSVSVMKFNGLNWVYVGNHGFSGEFPWYTSLAFNPLDGMPYVAFQDGAYSYKASVMKYDGSNWVSVGDPGFSSGQAHYTNLAFNQAGQPYVTYQDRSNNYQATVKKFEGNNWIDVGQAGFSPQASYYTSLAFSQAGEPYVAYGGDTESFPIKAAVFRFDGDQWVNVGVNGFSIGAAHGTNLAFNPANGQPYIAYSDGMLSFKAVVKRFNGNEWVDVGTPGFSVDIIDQPSLAFDQEGKPHVAFIDYGNNLEMKATVMMYDSSATGVDQTRNQTIRFYPNPAKDRLIIEIPENKHIVQLSIFAINGVQLIKVKNSEPRTEIDISILPPGVYIMKVIVDITVQVGMFIKE